MCGFLKYFFLLQVWLGIPFAAPPVGNLRWKPPQAPQSWSNVLPTQAYVCIYIHLFYIYFMCMFIHHEMLLFTCSFLIF